MAHQWKSQKLKTERRVEDENFPAMPTYLLLRIRQWKGKGKQRKGQEQIIADNALMKLAS